MGLKIRVFLRRSTVAALWVFGGGALVGLVFVLSFYLAMKVEMRSSQVVVPDLTGLTREDAGRVAGPLDLRIEVVDERHDPRVASGKVLQQVPPPGASVRRGRKLKVVLSLGGKVLTVPSLLGQATRTVGIELRQKGFIPGNEARVFSYDAPAGAVLAQIPPAGSPTVPGARVHRLVSDGPQSPQWVMPDLTGRSRREAQKWIALCGFRQGPVRRITAVGKPPGTVLGQLPLPGYPVRSKEVIELTVAR